MLNNASRWKKLPIERQRLIVWGAADQCRVNQPILHELGYEVIGLIDDTPNKQSPLLNIPIFHGEAGLNIFLEGNNFPVDLGFVVAIGNPYSKQRLFIHKSLEAIGLSPISFADKTALICSSVKYGAGLQVMPMAIVNNDVNIGNQCIVNTRSLVEHDCVLGDGVEIGPGAVLCGRVTVGSGTWIGANSTIRQRISIGKNSIVGAGAVVVQDVPDNVVVAGVPAKVIKENG